MEDYRDCLACGHSMLTDCDDRLYCVLHEKIVREDDVCTEFKEEG
ncbi:hypothetical protein SAMN05446037_100296 [Anaerovirgula multivorans]|uniref:Uncharacterized protein n=1 Tax=Anaerovirgula multivorans TaxID=312168 RepID=A0A239AKP7_9FIRM|nr:hypothetical protein SAMN05446037_100296 [Anaerovirgula multivorans]